MTNAVIHASVPMKQFRCPNGLRVWNAPKSRHDTHFLFKEIFERHCYEQHGISVNNGDVVLDIGANVGMFALSLMERFRDLKIVCAEPVPNTYACLERNLSGSPRRSLHDITLLDCAIGSTNADATIAFFPQMPSNSTLHLQEKRRHWERFSAEVTSSELSNLHRAFAFLPRRVFALIVKPMLKDAQNIKCKIQTLSDTIRQQALGSVDLLKIDIEGAEIEALNGLEEQHWPLIRQLVLEIEPSNKHMLSSLVAKLGALGFSKVTVQSFAGGTVDIEDSKPCTVYALRTTGQQ